MIQSIKTPIVVNAVNLKQRTERKLHIQSQFNNRAEFKLNIVSAIEHKRGASSLWQTIQHIIKKEKDSNSDYFIFCEDDHQFTEHYSFDLLKKCINNAIDLDADILSGGVSWLRNGIQVSDHLFWMETFTGLQFTVIFKKFYQTLLDANFGENVIADRNISNITDKKFVIHPFISKQKEFGYSDVTLKNNEDGRVENLYTRASNKLDILHKVRSHYFPAI